MEPLRRVWIADLPKKYPGQFSGGKQQRVAIARSLSMRPKIMLFDEAALALDPEMVKEVMDGMGELATDGMTMVCVTHETGFARSRRRQGNFMDHGTIVEQSTPEQVFDDPKEPRLREFLGQVLH